MPLLLLLLGWQVCLDGHICPCLMVDFVVLVVVLILVLKAIVAVGGLNMYCLQVIGTLQYFIV